MTPREQDLDRAAEAWARARGDSLDDMRKGRKTPVGDGDDVQRRALRRSTRPRPTVRRAISDEFGDDVADWFLGKETGDILGTSWRELAAAAIVPSARYRRVAKVTPPLSLPRPA